MSVKRGKIGEFAKRVKVGFVGTCEKYYTDDKRYPMIRTTNLTETGIDYSDLKYVTEEFYDKNKKSQLHDGDVLIARFGTSGTACVYHGGDAQCLNAIIVEPDIKTTIPEYLAIVVNSRSVRDQVKRRIVGSTQAILNTKVLSDIEIALPSLEKQRKVVEIFQSLQQICIQRKEELQALDSLIKARFVELFGMPVTNTKGWRTLAMGDVAPAVNYNGPFDERVWLLNLDMVETQTGRILDYLYVSENEVGNSTCTFDTSNVLYSKLRPYLNKVVIPDRCGYATSELVPLKPDLDVLDREYLAFMLRSDEFVNMINEKVAGAKMPRVSMGDFRKFDVPLPPLALQRQFADFVKQVDKSKTAVQKSLDKTQMLFDSLMQEYFG